MSAFKLRRFRHVRAPRGTSAHSISRARLLVITCAASLLLLGLAGASPALAGVWWHLASRPAPTVLTPGHHARLTVTATNVGDTGIDATASPVTITDTLPAGLEATKIQGESGLRPRSEHLFNCTLGTLSCTTQPELFPAFEVLQVTIEVNVRSDANAGELNQISVHGGIEEGGGAVAPAELSAPISVGPEDAVFGVHENGYGLFPEEEGGAADRQAGSHPFQLTTKVEFNETFEQYPSNLFPSVPALPKELGFNLPPGLIGNPQAVPQCPDANFSTSFTQQTNSCAPEDQIGVAVVTATEPARFGMITRPVPLWNLEPAPGEPARLGFVVIGVPVVLDTSIRSNGDYGVSVSVNNAPQSAQILASEVTIWGTPGDHRHDASRGWHCLADDGWFTEEPKPCQKEEPKEGQPAPEPFLTMPTSCTGTLASTVQGSSWPVKSLASEPGQIFTLQGQTETQLPGFEGCEHVPFTPSLQFHSTETQAATPTGLKVDVHVPQQETTLREGSLGESDLKDTSVTLPTGIELSPASAGGLQACSESQIGFEGLPGQDPFAPGPGPGAFADGAPQPLRFSEAPPSCPDASKMGVVRVHTPLLPHELTGAVYLAEPAPRGEGDKNPFNSLLALYIAVEDPATGVHVKLAGEVKLNETTGQITSSFLNAPQVPFEDFELEFFGGPRGSVSTPALCGAYQTQALFAPWSGSEAVNALSGEGEMQVTSGPGGSPCPASEPFAPKIQAGSANPQAGAFSAFSLQIERPDGNQPLSGLSVRLPRGAAAMLSSLTPCPEPQAAQGTCGPDSEIGQATASAGLGPDPYTESGKVYVTGPYDGAPFGLSIVTPAVAGPFNLGLVVVRSKIEVDPHTAQVSISGAVPTFIQGVGMPPTGLPLQLKRIYVTVNRPNFEFNPTSCEAKMIEGTLSGASGGSEAISTPFQVSGCQNLPFKPSLTAQTQGKTSKANGASFVVTVSSSPGQANIAKTVLVVPKILPARLSTIQKACLAKTFEANPASCPEGSNIGRAVVHTPVLKSALTGPAYLVSHGNAAWPDVEFVLQGEGIALILDGQTQIKGGVTTSSFNSVPDAPVSSFEAILPEGPHSALTTNLPTSAKYSLCGRKLTVPTTLTGQNGALIVQQTKVSVTGCGAVKAARAKKLSRAQKLKKALASCRKRFKRGKAKRAACERKAKRLYGPKRHKAAGRHAKSKAKR